jgi:hypothetical protein
LDGGTEDVDEDEEQVGSLPEFLKNVTREMVFDLALAR